VSVSLASAVLVLTMSAVAQAQLPIAAVSGGAINASSASSAANRTKEKVTIAIFESFGTPNLNAVVRRTKGNSGAVLIAVKRSALSGPLLAALMAAVPSSSGKMRATSDRFDIYFREGTPLGSGRTVDPKTVAAVLNDLHNAQLQQIQGVGKYPAITISL
jgi:hypothetical protein